MSGRVRTLLGDKLDIDWKLATITVVSTLLLMIDEYHPLTSSKALDRFFLYLVVPVMVIALVFRESPRDYGLRLGDWKAGLALTAIGIAVMAPVLWFLGTRDASMQAYYAGSTEGLLATNALDLIGWEFVFRGFLLFGLARKYGHDAIWLQMVPFALAHLGKPEIETLSTVLGGFAFGWVAWRTRSFLYPFLIHLFVATFIVLVASWAV